MNADYQEQFRDAIRAAGMTPPDEIELDGELHRFASNGKRNDSAGYYVFHGDGIPAGVFGDWRSGMREKWHADIGRALSPAEAAEVRQRAVAVQTKHNADVAERQAKARKRAAGLLQKSEAAREDHPYLKRKGIKPHGIRQCGDNLAIPMRDASGDLHSLQWITRDGVKRFLAGGRSHGCYFSIGEPDGILCIAEGYATAASIHEATGHAVAVAFNAGNLEPVTRALHAKYPNLKLILCADDDYRTDGNPGIARAIEAARAVGGLVAVPDFGADRPDDVSDFNDMHQHRGAEAVKQAMDNAKPADIPEGQPPAADVTAPVLDGDQATIEHLATLSPIAYDRCRVAEAKRLGVRPSTLDREVSRARGDSEPGEGSDSTAIFREPNPWSQPVDGMQLLSAVSDMVRRFVILPQHADAAVALWIVLTYCIDWAQVAPILAVTSPEKRCGKSTLLFVIDRLSSRPLSSSNISAPALFRAVEKWQPTLIIDEADSFIRDSEEMRGVLNSGHTRPTAYVIRTTGEDFEPRRFSTWGAKAIALIGSLPDTLQDRSIVIDLRRKLSNESAEKLRHIDDNEFSELTSKLERWAADHGSKIAYTRMPAVARLRTYP
jgi:putative DNA primase/helicase